MAASVQEASVWVGIGPGVVAVQQANGSTTTTHFTSHNILDGEWHHLSVIFDSNGLQVCTFKPSRVKINIVSRYLLQFKILKKLLFITQIAIVQFFFFLAGAAGQHCFAE